MQTTPFEQSPIFQFSPCRLLFFFHCFKRDSAFLNGVGMKGPWFLLPAGSAKGRDGSSCASVEDLALFGHHSNQPWRKGRRRRSSASLSKTKGVGRGRWINWGYPYPTLSPTGGKLSTHTRPKSHGCGFGERVRVSTDRSTGNVWRFGPGRVRCTCAFLLWHKRNATP